MTTRKPNDAAAAAHERLFPGHVSTLAVTDPELIEYFDDFAFDEVVRHTGDLDERTRLMTQLAAMIARVFDFLHAANDVLTGRGIELPLEGQSTTGPDTRMEQGLVVQKRIVGEKAVDARAKGHVAANLNVGKSDDFEAQPDLAASTDFPPGE